MTPRAKAKTDPTPSLPSIDPILAKRFTVVSALRLCGDSRLNEIRREMGKYHLLSLKPLLEAGGKHVFVDCGSDPILEKYLSAHSPASQYIRLESDRWMESRSKNRGLREVKTDWVAFTNADTILHPDVFNRTGEIIGDNEHFILQGYRWEAPWEISRNILAGAWGWPFKKDEWAALHNLSVPHSFPRNPTGEWQVTTTDIAEAVYGFDERMDGEGAASYGGMDTDFHDRAGMLAIRRGGAYLLSRRIPVVHFHHHAFRPFNAANHALRRENLYRFIEEGTEESLVWPE